MFRFWVSEKYSDLAIVEFWHKIGSKYLPRNLSLLFTLYY